MAEYKFVNPDMMLSGDVSLGEECNFSMRPTIHKDGTLDADLDCPYDGTYCRQKDYRVTRWKKAVAYAATRTRKATLLLPPKTCFTNVHWAMTWNVFAKFAMSKL